MRVDAALIRYARSYDLRRLARDLGDVARQRAPLTPTYQWAVDFLLAQQWPSGAFTSLNQEHNAQGELTGFIQEQLHAITDYLDGALAEPGTLR